MCKIQTAAWPRWRKKIAQCDALAALPYAPSLWKD
jgi:hypothetical protein